MTSPTDMTLLLASRYYEGGLLDQAETHCRQALDGAPDHIDTLVLLGAVLRDGGRYLDANEVLSHASALEPNNPDILNALGDIQQRRGHFDQARHFFQQALDVNPDMAEALYNLGIEERRIRHHCAAAALFRRAIDVLPDLKAAHHNLGGVYKDMGRVADAMGCFNKALELDPDFLPSHINRLYTAHYEEQVNFQSLFDQAKAFGKQIGKEPEPLSNQADPKRNLRVGYISGDFHTHPIGFFALPFLTHHDKSNFDIYCYDNGTREDALTLQLKEQASHWTHINTLDDGKAAQTIKDDRIDILVDLSGYTARSRLNILSRRLAPVQIAWIGSVGTTGLSEVDVFLGDEVGVAPSEEKYFTEQVVRLPHGWLCYAPPAYAPDVTPPPHIKNGVITFGCFNNLSKISQGAMALWSQILQAIPDSRLLLRNTTFDDKGIRQQTQERFAALGIDQTRLDLLPPLPHPDLLAAYGDIDIALDPFPYSGGLTTCEALWMGVPVVTLKGKTFAGRHTASHLSNVGLTDWITDNSADYLAKAVALAEDSDGLVKWRGTLREQIKASPLTNAAAFTRNLENAYRDLWHNWCLTET